LLARRRGESATLPTFETPLVVRASTAAPPDGKRPRR
jgi:hypothetical protein